MSYTYITHFLHFLVISGPKVLKLGPQTLKRIHKGSDGNL